MNSVRLLYSISQCHKFSFACSISLVILLWFAWRGKNELKNKQNEFKIVNCIFPSCQLLTVFAILFNICWSIFLLPLLAAKWDFLWGYSVGVPLCVYGHNSIGYNFVLTCVARSVEIALMVEKKRNEIPFPATYTCTYCSRIDKDEVFSCKFMSKEYISPSILYEIYDMA